MSEATEQRRLYITERPILVARNQELIPVVIEGTYEGREPQPLEYAGSAIISDLRNKVVLPELRLGFDLAGRDGGLHLRETHPFERKKWWAALVRKKTTTYQGVSLHTRTSAELLRPGTPVYIGGVLDTITESEQGYTLVYNFQPPNKIMSVCEGTLGELIRDFEARRAWDRAKEIN